ncbi:MAG: ABC-type multidrug transport system ATPase subunit [Kiritimatiellia bacterium]|jgi:ABC-type multidrug transport system ATPase subunit
MLTAHLEDRFREALGDQATADRDESIRFAVEFVRMLARIVPDDVSPESNQSLMSSISARTDLSPDEIGTLLKIALAPEHRAEITDDELRAFGSRFGSSEEAALRAAVEEEINLAGFAERYGSAEALLLLDSLFAVCAVDGLIDRREISRLQHSATELGIDAMLVGALFRKHDVRHATGDFTFELVAKDEFIIGRATTASLQLPDPQVSPRHAKLLRDDNGWRVVDLGSGRPTLVNGTPVSTAPLMPGDDLRIGPYRLNLDRNSNSITAFGQTAFSALHVGNVSRTISTRKGPLTLLDEVNFTVFSGEVIALVGPSGAGKTTLLNAIAGIAPPDSGQILLDRSNFHNLLTHDRSLVGIVPQEDLVHGELTVEEALFYAGRFRFGGDVKRQTIQVEVDRVLGELGIDAIRNSRIGSTLKRGISGGQRKRVNLGQELLTHSTKVLFLDEPTSGLDPQTAQDIVGQVRQLADDGRIVFIVTHDVSPGIMALVDHLMVLAPGGRLAWFGPPDEACAWFGVKSADEIFGRLAEKTPLGWKEAYLGASPWRKYVRTREHLLGLGTIKTEKATPRHVQRSPLLQYRTLTTRYLRVKTRDITGTGVLMAQAPILALALWIVFPHPDIATMFMLVLSSLWFGASASVRELISERALWRREARVGLSVLPYMASKVTVLGGLVILQCIMLTTIVWTALSMWNYGFNLFALTAVTVSTGLVGMAMGLAVSSVFGSSEAAVGTLPLLIIPQITFGGLIVKVKDMSVLATAAAYTMIVRYSYEASIKTGEELSKPGHRGVGESQEHIKRFLYDLGFRGTDADDMGMHMGVLMGVLVLFFFGFLGLSTFLTWRSRRGN